MYVHCCHYLPSFLRNALVRFLSFLCLCLFIFNRLFRKILVSCMPPLSAEGAGGAEKGRSFAMYSDTDGEAWRSTTIDIVLRIESDSRFTLAQ